MRLIFEDDDLCRLAYEASYRTRRWPAEVTRSYRRRIQQIEAAVDERDLRNLKALRLEQLKGNRRGTSSIRINDKYRLIVRFESDEAGRVTVVIDGLDYH
ncbi:proteic killer suppression protein [Austwickia chelonae]|uniref:Plasmid maintenance system killer protein n=1 Tax=Austwickia chelonae NBRC 105200 TaxID=1184607 RepID=K6VPV6_9MICO|nr:type II toxin-antitoxin system RelE/ParE family toxin [Austwickia chelonae]GAB78779.1 hypothetical protein AUCHE_16_02020 [Austwickia chelonae NBRC 105200]SEW35371.1 proteic killer suppression protein [Austwickia chelonae]